MLIGNLFNLLIIILSALSIVFYIKKEWVTIGRFLYLMQAMVIILSSALLLYLILSNNFQIYYVYEYSSSDLSLAYLVSAFWAGQQGSFLLWILMTAILGLFLLQRNYREEPVLLSTISFFHIFIGIILWMDSPFAYIWEVFQNVPENFIPADGAGLNPLLLDPWMIIHPPVLFLGYAAAIIPFGFALSAIIYRDYHQWVRGKSFYWSLFATLFLGAGTILGAYWAYITLGWGGYWAWDPVENSSLIPWLSMMALFHGFLVYNRTRAYNRLNLFLAILTWFFVIWGTYCTRSGIFAQEDLQVSVHTFGATPAFGALTFMLVFYLFTPMTLYIYSMIRDRKQPFLTGKAYKSSKAATGKQKKFANTIVNPAGMPMDNYSLFNRGVLLFYGSMVLFMASLAVLFISALPLITYYLSPTLFDHPIVPTKEMFNYIIGTIAIFMLLLMGFYPMTNWKGAITYLKKKYILIIGFGLLLGLILGIIFIADIFLILLFLAGFFVFFTNLEKYFEEIYFGWKMKKKAVDTKQNQDNLEDVDQIELVQPKTGLISRIKERKWTIIFILLFNVFVVYLLYFLGMFKIHFFYYLIQVLHLPIGAASIVLYILLTGLTLLLYLGGGFLKRGSASLTHIGVGMMIMGIILSAVYSKEKNITLELGRQVSVFDIVLEFVGIESTQIKDRLSLDLQAKDASGNPLFIATDPQLYLMTMGQQMQKNFTPALISSFSLDYYISPVEYMENEVESLTIKKGEGATVAGYTIVFTDYIWPSNGGHMSGDTSWIGTNLQIFNSEDQLIEEMQPKLYLSSQQMGHSLTDVMPIPFLDTGYFLRLSNIYANEASIGIEITSPFLLLQVSTKPLISLIWIGTIILCLGFIASVARRRIVFKRVNP